MSIAEDAGRKTVFETGNEPEYFVEEIARVEVLGGGMVRLYVASERQGCLRIEYTVVIRKERLAEAGRMCLIVAADAHNLDLFSLHPEIAH